MFKKVFNIILFSVVILSGCNGKIVLEESVDLDNLNRIELTYLETKNSNVIYGLNEKNKDGFYKIYSVNDEFHLENNNKNKFIVHLDENNLYLNENEKYLFKDSHDNLSSFEFDTLDDIKPSSIIKGNFDFIGIGFEKHKNKYDYEAYFYNKSLDEYFEVDVEEADYLSNLWSLYGSTNIKVIEYIINKDIILTNYQLNLNGYWLEAEKSSLSEIERNMSKDYKKY